MNLNLAKKRVTNIAWASLTGIVVPFILGFGMVVLFPNLWIGHFHV